LISTMIADCAPLKALAAMQVPSIPASQQSMGAFETNQFTRLAVSHNWSFYGAS
jgi:hypothetical protein